MVVVVGHRDGWSGACNRTRPAHRRRTGSARSCRKGSALPLRTASSRRRRTGAWRTFPGGEPVAGDFFFPKN
ncbi:unnamed protein product [Linum trigynum]|uniref:Uncharacterized protein n=1 Tax=Linum trigynum TaxID=586398 RepID=A0AAV2G5D1_9ROSI